ncbi:MAG: type II toxin-antitoxin system HigB family toxin [Gallionella sp.]
MEIKSNKAVRIFAATVPESESSLNRWLTIVSKTQFADFNALHATFPSADVVKDVQGRSLTVFNIHGNKYRLIAAIHYNHNILYIRHILTHAEYDKGKWKA